MQCISPISIPRPGGAGSSDRIEVPCGKCYACLSRKRSEWAFRLQKEQKYSTSSYFFTLTYDDEHIPVNENGFPSVSKDDVQRFMKRLRKMYAPNKIRYFITSEYGPTTFRPHYHGILFNAPVASVDGLYRDLEKSWRLGFVEAGTVTPSSINYCAKYCISKHSAPSGCEPCFNLMSRRPGLGSAFLEKNGSVFFEKLQDWTVFPGGYRVRLPRFFREKLFDPQRRRILANRVQAFQEEQRKELEEYLASIGKSYPVYIHEVRQDYNRRMEKQLTKKSKHFL
jgi:hypothetical protein